MGKKTKSTSVAAPVAPVPTASTKSKKSKHSSGAPQAAGNVRHRSQRRKHKLYMVSIGQAKRLALRAGEKSISIKKGVPQFLTVQVHHMVQTLGNAARTIADTRKRDSTVRASDVQEAIRTQFHFRVYNTSSMLSDEKHARRIRNKRLAREREQSEKKREALAAADAATSEAAGA